MESTSRTCPRSCYVRIEGSPDEVIFVLTSSPVATTNEKMGNEEKLFTRAEGNRQRYVCIDPESVAFISTHKRYESDFADPLLTLSTSSDPY